MAPTHSKPSPNKLRTQRKLVIPPIGLERPTEKKDYAKGEFATVKLRNVPNDATSMTYDYQVPFFTTGTPEEWLKFKARFNRVITGQHMTTAVQKYACARRFLQGQALSTFNNMAEEQPNVNMANFDLCLNHVNESMFPQKAYITQTRWMRRYLRKPREMKTRDYVNRVLELNGYLTEFPTPNNNQANKLEDDEIMDILEFSLPSRWRSTMVLQGFNAAEKTTAEFIEFCERLEMTEPESEMADDRIPKKKQSSGSEKKQGATKRKRGDENSEEEGDCILHGDNCGHTSHKCRTLKRMAKKAKDDWNKKGPKKKEDLQTMIAESFTIAVKNMRKKKKEKKEEKPKVEFDLKMLENLSVSDSDKEEGELPNLSDASSNS